MSVALIGMIERRQLGKLGEKGAWILGERMEVDAINCTRYILRLMSKRVEMKGKRSVRITQTQK